MDEITYPLSNCNDSTVEDWELISDFIPIIKMILITAKSYQHRNRLRFDIKTVFFQV